MNTSFTIKLLFLSLACFPQLASAFVWENTEESRKEWRKIIGNTFIKECRNNPTEECLKGSSLLKLTKDVCGKVPPGMSVADHLGIFRDVCVNDVQVTLERAKIAINKASEDAKSRAKARADDISRANAQDERDRKIALQKKQDDDRDLQRKLEQENQRSMEAKRQQELEAKKLENQQKMEKLLK